MTIFHIKYKKDNLFFPKNSKTQTKQNPKSHTYTENLKELYLSGMSEAAEDVILFHPGKQVSDPKRANLFRPGSLLGRVLGLGLSLLRLGPSRLLLWDLLLLLLLHHPLLLLLLLRRRSGSGVRLLVLLFRRHLLWDHLGCWLLHHDGTCFVLYEY